MVKVVRFERARQRQGPPPRRRNAAARQREYLTEREVEALIEAARRRAQTAERRAQYARYVAHRNSTLILLVYRHALRVAEAIDLQWSDLELEGPNHRLHVRRVKAGVASVHPLTGRETRALRRLQREQAARGHSGP